MRFRIKFILSGKKQLLPLNYQYPVSAWIYKVLATANKEFTKILHEEGYKIESGKAFKLFTFSRFSFPNHTWKIIPHSDRMQVWARNAWLEVSFQYPKQGETFLTGLFNSQKVYVGDKISGVKMEVSGIEALREMDFNQNNDKAKVEVKAITPIVMGLNTEENKYEQYISPEHPAYKNLFLQNLIDKYKLTGKDYISKEDMDIEIIKIYPKTSLQTIKAHTTAETKVRGYYFDFELYAPTEIIKLGLNAGFGSMNSLGFGWCGVGL